MIPVHADFQIIAGEGRRRAGIGILGGAEREDAELDDGTGDFVRKRGGFGGGALGKRKNVEVGEGQAFDEGRGRGVVGFGFAGEAGDYVGADGSVGEAFMDELDAAGVMFGAIPAVHGGENAVGGGLQGHVEVLGDVIGGSEEIDQVSRDVKGLDGADAEAFDGGFVEDAAEEVFEFDAGGEAAAVGAEVDAAENDFAVARIGEALDFVNDCVGWEAAALAADKGDDTVRAAGVATVLDFESGAGVIAFSAEDRSGEESVLFEYITGKNLAR